MLTSFQHQRSKRHEQKQALGHGRGWIRWLFHQLTVKDYVWEPGAGQRGPERDLESTRRFLSRFGEALAVEGRSGLDVGCGSGHLCFELARLGASRVVGADISDLQSARSNLRSQPAEVQEKVRFIRTDGSLKDLGPERFDLVFSKDSFEHFADPEAVLAAMKEMLVPGGRLMIGFGPLWKAPTGGHIGFMTKLPWAHLLFPESVVMAERRRFRPREDARRFEEIRGGLNKMTLARFEGLMAASGLRRSYFATNVSDNPVVRAMAILQRVRPLREYFSANVYSIWEAPGG